FDSRIRQEPADHTAVRRYSAQQMRDAFVWREILGPPVSERPGRMSYHPERSEGT
ncbi:MAG: hypothetical protein H0T44_01770, partial [Gemmatimonadales bacterium]|nr:hypothetical protein [Gemmatimonadales bacterium]